MRYLPRWSASVWALLVLLTGSAVVCLSPAWSADQKPLVINPTTGKQEQLQPGNRLQVPDASGDMVVLDPGVQTAARVLSVPVLTGDATVAVLSEAQTFTGAKTFSETVTSTAAGNSAIPSGGFVATDIANTNKQVLIGVNSATSEYFIQAAEQGVAFRNLTISPAGGGLVIGSPLSGFVYLPNASGTSLAIESITDSTSKDTGSIVTEGGIGAEKAIFSGTQVAVGSSVSIDSGLPGLQLSQSGNVAWSNTDNYFNTKDTSVSRYAAGVVAIGTGPQGNDDGLIQLEGIFINEGSNARMGIATLVGGTVTVNTTAVTANSRIYLTSQADGGTVGFQRISARTPGTDFTITSSNVLDTSTVAWMIVEPAP